MLSGFYYISSSHSKNDIAVDTIIIIQYIFSVCMLKQSFKIRAQSLFSYGSDPHLQVVEVKSCISLPILMHDFNILHKATHFDDIFRDNLLDLSAIYIVLYGLMLNNT